MERRTGFLTLLLGAVLTAPAAAQFDLFTWTNLPGGEDGWGTVEPGEMDFGTGFDEPFGFQGFLTRTPVDGSITVTLADFNTWDGMCEACVPAFSHNGEVIELASCAIENQPLRFTVAAGDGFGFGLKVNSPYWPAEATFTNFEFTPTDPFAYWTDLGQSLGGQLGPPLLTGQGLLYGGMPIKLHLTNAAPQQPATIVIGAHALNAPFKGGVMVPTPNLIVPAGLVGMGTLDFAATWPNNLPPGVQLWIQFWIVDPTAPLGLSATNGLLAATP